MKKFLSRIAVVLAAGATTATVATAQTVAVPASINYQGVLADGLGNRMPDGNTNVVFRLFTLALGGNPVWGPKTNSVAVVGGSFNTLIGGADRQTPARDFGAVMAAQSLIPNTSVYLEVSVGNNPVVPRQQILSAPYAMLAGNAGKLNGFSWADLLNAENPVTGKLDGSKIAPGTIPAAALSPAADQGSVVVSGPLNTPRLKVIRGTVRDIGVNVGSGYTTTWDGTKMNIAFSTPFSGFPTVTVSAINAAVDANTLPIIYTDYDANGARVHLNQLYLTQLTATPPGQLFGNEPVTWVNPGITFYPFSFIAIGPE